MGGGPRGSIGTVFLVSGILWFAPLGLAFWRGELSNRILHIFLPGGGMSGVALLGIHVMGFAGLSVLGGIGGQAVRDLFGLPISSHGANVIAALVISVLSFIYFAVDFMPAHGDEGGYVPLVQLGGFCAGC